MENSFINRLPFLKHLYFYITIFLILMYACSDRSKPITPIGLLDLRADEHEVTVGEFREFIYQTNYQTTADSLGWSGYFDTLTHKWVVKEGANWEHHDGIHEVSEYFPVVHISYYDACAYCAWKKGRLPTASEWDLIAGDSVITGNIWEGLFPVIDQGNDGYSKQLAPVKQFSPNKNGYYDLFGNVWEWTSSLDPQQKRILKGGSFLCDFNVCRGYVPRNFQTTDDDSGLNHLGIRCVYDLQ